MQFPYKGYVITVLDSGMFACTREPGDVVESASLTAMKARIDKWVPRKHIAIPALLLSLYSGIEREEIIGISRARLFVLAGNNEISRYRMGSYMHPDAAREAAFVAVRDRYLLIKAQLDEFEGAVKAHIAAFTPITVEEVEQIITNTPLPDKDDV